LIAGMQPMIKKLMNVLTNCIHHRGNSHVFHGSILEQILNTITQLLHNNAPLLQYAFLQGGLLSQIIIILDPLPTAAPSFQLLYDCDGMDTLCGLLLNFTFKNNLVKETLGKEQRFLQLIAKALEYYTTTIITSTLTLVSCGDDQKKSQEPVVLTFEVLKSLCGVLKNILSCGKLCHREVFGVTGIVENMMKTINLISSSPSLFKGSQDQCKQVHELMETLLTTFSSMMYDCKPNCQLIEKDYPSIGELISRLLTRYSPSSSAAAGERVISNKIFLICCSMICGLIYGKELFFQTSLGNAGVCDILVTTLKYITTTEGKGPAGTTGGNESIEMIQKIYKVITLLANNHMMNKQRFGVAGVESTVISTINI